MRMFGSIATLLLTLTPVVATAAPAKSAKPATAKKTETVAQGAAAVHTPNGKAAHAKHARMADRTRGHGIIIVEKSDKTDKTAAHKNDKGDKADAKALPQLPAASLTTPIAVATAHDKAAKPGKGKHGSMHVAAHAAAAPHASVPVHADRGDKVDAEKSMKGVKAHAAKFDKSDKGDKSDKADKTDKGGDKMPLLRADVPLITPIATAKPTFKPGCVRPSITFFRGTEEEAFTLTKCDGSVAPLAIERLSVLARAGAVKPSRTIAELAKAKGPVLAPGVRRLDPRLAEDMQRVVDHFAKSGKTPNVHLVSGYRPTSEGSFHQSGHAIDFRLEGVENEAVVEFCKTLNDVGCGYYPNSSFVHMDVREKGAGHVAWIDASGPGESPRYVSEWPPRKPKFITAIEESLAKLDKAEAEGHEGKPAEAKSKTVDADDKNADAPAAAMTVPLDDDFNGAR